MFNRPNQTYNIKEIMVDAVLQYYANPLKHIALLVCDGSKYSILEP
jgi:hypothetical protein